MIKQGAMFGLDARIALAIFGALSVISGAALYSAIQESKVTSLLADLNEINKAVEQYYLDNTQWLVHNDPAALATSSQFYDLRLNALLEDHSVSTWISPYISGFSVYSGGIGIEKKPLRYGAVMLTPDDSSWGDSERWWNHSTSFCTSGRLCNIWLSFGVMSNTTLVEALDKKVDNSDGAYNGKVKWFSSAANSYYGFYKINPIKNPND